MVVKELIGLLGIQTDPQSFKQGETKLNNLVGFAKNAAGAIAGFFAVKWVVGAVNQVAQLGDQFKDMSARIGVGTDELQKLGYVAQLTGASLMDVQTAIKKLQVAQAGAADGTATNIETFKKLGVEIRNADGTLKDSTQLFYEISDGLKGVKTDAERTQLAVQLFGRGGTALIPMLKEGGAALRGMTSELEDLGGVMSGDLIAASDAYMDNQTKLKNSMLGIKYTLAEELLPYINRGTEALLKWWRAEGKIVRQDIGKFFKKWGGVLENVADFLGKVGKFLYNFWKNLDPSSKGVLKLAAALLVFIKLLQLGVLKKWVIILALVVLAIEDLNVFLNDGNSLLGRFFSWLKKVSGIDIAPTIKEFAQALKVFSMSPEPFDWGMWGEEIVRVIDQYLKVAAEEWKNLLGEDAWNALQTFAGYVGQYLDIVISYWENLGKAALAVKDLLIGIWTEPRQAWETFKESISNSIADFAGTIANVLEPVIAWLSGWAERALQAIASPFRAAKDWIKNLLPGGDIPVNVPLPQGYPDLPTLQGGKAAIEGATGMSAGFGIAPAMSSTKSSYATINAPVNAPITINAAPGMDEKKIGQVARNELQSVLDKQNRQTMRALKPQRAT